MLASYTLILVWGSVMKRLSSLIVGFLFAISVSNLFAQGVKVGVVDLQKIMQTSAQMKTIQQQLEQDMEKFKRDNTVMSDAQKKEFEKKIITAQQLFERQGQQYQQELSTAHNEAMEGLYTKIRGAIKKVAEAQKYDLILQKDAAPFSVDSLDVTPEVIKNIG